MLLLGEILSLIKNHYKEDRVINLLNICIGRLIVSIEDMRVGAMLLTEMWMQSWYHEEA